MAYAGRSLSGLFLFFLGLLPGGLAQPERNEREQPCRFSVFCTGAAGGLGFEVGGDAPPAALVFYPSARSPGYDYRGAAPLRLIDLLTRQVVAEANIPSEMTEVLLILVPTRSAIRGGLRYQTFVLDDRASARGAGSLGIINFSGLALSGRVDGKSIDVRRGLNAIRPTGRVVRVNLRTSFKQRSYQAYVGEIALGKDERALLLLLPPFERGSLEVQARLLRDSAGAGEDQGRD